MPHLVVEYSDNIVEKPDSKKLMTGLHNILYSTGLFRIADMKSRLVVHHDYLVGDGDPSRAFVTLAISILAGHGEETKKELTQKCSALLKETFEKSFNLLKLSITVQVKELDFISYNKESSY